METTQGEASDKDHEQPRFVVGVGASAGGLEALEQLFAEMPIDTGLAFVVVQHLSPDFKSLMDELLGRRTRLPVLLVEDGMPVAANRVYLIPPKKEMIISGGRLLLSDKAASAELSLPIDVFFRSLAEDLGPRAIGVVLSGGGSDGSRGIRDIHEGGGLVICQDDASAAFDGMPKSAAATGIVDHVCAPRQIPSVLQEYVQQIESGDRIDRISASAGIPRGTLSVFRLLEREYGIDFSSYKPSTVTRRIERRVQITQVSTIDEYADRLTTDREELDALYRDLLIGVTRFFRDEEPFGQLEQTVIPELLSRAKLDDELRVWVPGCATGEEAYSLGILVLEALEARGDRRRVKIFATDVHSGSLEFAARGLYSDDSVKRVGEARLARFFNRLGASFQVSPDLRQMVVFARHNVMRDAPFTRVDLVSCRNLLIYLQPAAQRRVLGLFHFALKREGILFLGPSENAAALADDFEAIDAHWRIYRKHRDLRLGSDARFSSPRMHDLRSPTSGNGAANAAFRLSDAIGVYDALLDEYMPASLLVNERRELVHAFGGAGRWIKLKDGRPSLDVLEMVDHDLKLALAGALQRATKEQAAVVFKGLRMAVNGEDRLWRLAVRPISNKRGHAGHLLVTIEPSEPDAASAARHEIDMGDVSKSNLSTLEDELRYTKESLQNTIEELETSNEELQSINEEMLAANEELQSTNEELQSVNEELYTVNAEYQRKIAQLTELTNDMDNLLQSTDVGTVFLDRSLSIRKFTPRVAEVFNLLPQDVGRPIAAFSNTLCHPGLADDLDTVLRTSEPLEREVRDASGDWFFLRILPYKSGGAVDGVVLTLIDIATLKAAEDALFRERHLLDGLMESLPDAIYFKDGNGAFVRLNRAMARRLGVMNPSDAVGKKPSDFLPAEMAAALEEADARVLAGEDQTYRLEQAGQTGFWYMATRQPLRDRAGNIVGMFGVSRDVSEQKQAEDEIKQSVVRRDQFLAMLSHELRNPLSAIVSASKLLGDGHVDDATLAANVIARQSRHMARLLDDLLEASRVTQNKINLDRRIVDVRPIAKEAVEAVKASFADRGINLRLALGDSPALVDGDPARLQQVLVNLLGNAAKYTQRGGEASLAVTKEGSHIALIVRDNGAGIPRKHLRTIFDMFFQGEGSLPPGDSGMGLGLALVRALIDMHGGHVSAQSDGPGQGSTFIVRLPQALALAPSAPPTPKRRIRWKAGKRIVLVDDNIDGCAMLMTLLSRAGCEVHCAHDGLTGIELIDRVRPDVALIDIGLPGTSGYEVARRLRSCEEHDDLYIVAVTGFGRPADRAAALQAGFDEHVTKPLHPDDLHGLLWRDVADA
ncbi:MAG: PAS domain-containing protein [Polyangiaceae bacterium]|nr:PAS domain-containing protein [Polyangiaceae bacterium]